MPEEVKSTSANVLRRDNSNGTFSSATLSLRKLSLNLRMKHKYFTNEQHDDVLQFAPNFDDHHGYFETPSEKLLPWSAFNHTIESNEVEIQTLFETMKDAYKDVDEEVEVFDLRPYMID